MKKNKKVLIIDDDEGILLSVRVILEHEGYTVASEGDAGHALSIVKKEAPNVILLDMLLSGQDGREICKLLKKNKSTKHIPVVMFSAHPTAREQALSAGADNFLAKPFNMTELLSAMNTTAKSRVA